MGGAQLSRLQGLRMSGLLCLTDEGNESQRGEEIPCGESACPTRSCFSENLLPKPQAGTQPQDYGNQLDEE